jgi:hypothetical protein
MSARGRGVRLPPAAFGRLVGCSHALERGRAGVQRAVDQRGCLRRRDVPAGWVCGLALDVAWPPQILRCGRQARCVCSSSGAQTTYGLAQIPGVGIAGQLCHPQSSLRTAYRRVRRATVTLCPRARPASKRQRPAPADPRQGHRPRGPRAIPSPGEAITRACSGSAMSQPYSPSISAMERGDNIRPMLAIGQPRRSVGSFWPHRR